MTNMTWILTSDGHEASLEYPLQSDYEIERIAHSLAQINRFNGHTARPYSVAEHSLLVCDIADRHLGLDVYGQFAALMHDAHESSIGDITSPVRAQLGPAWDQFERRFERAVAQRFGFTNVQTVYHHELRAADLLALAIERNELLPHETPAEVPCRPWPVLSTTSILQGYELMSPMRRSMTWQDWRDAFIERFQELQFGRAEVGRERLAASQAKGAA